jgi:hypothetical protein
MIKYFMKQQKSVPASRKTDANTKKQGQALIEYVLILAIAFIGLIAILAITAPAIGNVWSNTVFNLLGQTTIPQEPLEEAEFWELITAVASYTPEAVDLITNTPPNPTDVPTIGPSPTYTPTVPTATATDTATAGPSPTPEDRNFGFPFSDDGNDDTTFQGDNFLDLFASGPWNAEYWGSSACSSGSIFNATTGDGGGAQATAQVDKIDFPNSSLPDDYWQTDTDRPYPGISTDFCSRFENTITLEAKTYTFKYRKDDGVRVYIDGVRVIDDWNWSPNYDNWITFDWVNATAGAKSVRIVHRDTGGGARLVVQLTSGGQANTDNCEWQLTNDRYRSGPTSWHSNEYSPPGEYGNNQFCVLRLRGTIDLSGANNPFLEFYDAFELDRDADSAIVGISVAGSGIWNDLTIHVYETNYAFQRQSFRMSSFTGSQGTVDYRGQQIEVRFVLQSDGYNTDDGWWIDDISVYDRPDLRYTIGFFDDVEGAEYWVPNGTWARSPEHVRSGSYAWSDSPGGANYVVDSNSTLDLNGRLDLTQGTVSLPQISFWHSYDLHTTYDAIYIELSTDLVNWEALRSGSADTTDYIARATDAPSFIQEVVDIPASYWGLDTIFVRFRLYADTNGQVADGWWIDDIEFRNKPQDTIRANWCDDVETGTGNWIPGGDWATTPAKSHDGSLSWTDSPGGNYVDGSNTTLELKPYVDMSAPLTRPVFEFWHSYSIERNEGMYVEVSVDDGNSWSVVWSYTSGYGNRPFGFGNSISAHDYKYNNNQTWVREAIELSSYIGIPSASPAPSDPLGIRLRFRLDARSNSNVADGWYIDSICVRQVNDEPVRTIPFAEDFEAGSDNWLMTGDWSLSNEETHGGTNALSDRAGADYRHETYSYVELKPTIDLTTATSPVLYFFERYALEQRDRTMVIIRPVDASGAPLGNWEVAPYSNQYRDTNLGWTRNETDISSYAGQYIRVRFLIDALYDGRVDEGWWVDDVQILDRTVAEAGFQYNGDPYFADLEVIVPGEWVFDHTWDTVNSFRDQGSGGNLGPGQWSVTWYDNVQNACSGSAQLASVRNTTTEDEINFNWGNSFPSGTGITDGDRFGAIFRRTLAFPEAAPFTFTGRVDDAIRIYDNGNLVYDFQWNSCGNTSFESSPYTFTAGVHNVEVHYYESGGGARVELGFAGESSVFHDSPSGDYEHETDTRVELEGEINLAGTTNPVMFWDEKYYIGWGDSIRVEISNDGGFSWNSVYSRGSGDNNNWTERWVDLSSYSGQKITIRFRLDARSNSNVDDGWYIDNIRIFE